MTHAVTTGKDVGFTFQDYNVLAIQGNRKTQTRRLMYPQPPRGCTVGNISTDDGEVLEWILCDEDGDAVDAPCPKPVAKAGDRMFVREVYQEFCPLWDGAWCGHSSQEGMAQDHYIVYRASNPDGAFVWKGEVIHCEGWKVAKAMPKRCARFFRDMLGVEAQRVQDITVKDAIAEGCPESWVSKWVSHEGCAKGVQDMFSPVEWYHTAWARLNGHESWDGNLWVWKYTWAHGPARPLPARTEYSGG